MSKAKVLKLVKSKVNKETVDYLKNILKEAKEGKLVGVGMIGVCPNGDFCSGWSGDTRYYKNTFLGAITFLKERLLREMF